MTTTQLYQQILLKILIPRAIRASAFKKMCFKSLVLLLILTSFSLNFCNGQNYNRIEKAKDAIQAGKAKKALRILKRADRSSYGYCANASFMAHNQIDSLSFIAHMKLNNYEKARECLYQMESLGKRPDLDSLIIDSYRIQYDKILRNNKIDFSLSKSLVECKEDECFGYIPLVGSNDIAIKLKLRPRLEFMFMDDDQTRTMKWVNEFKRSKAYKFIQSL